MIALDHLDAMRAVEAGDHVEGEGEIGVGDVDEIAGRRTRSALRALVISTMSESILGVEKTPV